ncbi:MAG TPA: adenylate/guanylate cyclase domain-containing protein [Candidatus Limnocylindria bacterium]
MDSDDVRLRKALLVAIALLVAALAVFWGVLYVAFGEPLGGAIPLTYTVISLGSVVVFAITRRFDWFRLTQLTAMLVLPFVLMVVLGGFVPSSVVVAWAFVAPLGALAFATPREAVRWFIAYIALVFLTGFLGGSLRSTNNLPPGVVLALFVLNIAGVSIVVFLALYASVRERDRAFEVVRRLFGQYLSPQIARALLTDPGQARLGGENRDITALFADLQGFTPFTEAHPPAETVRVLNRYFGAVVPVIFANGGTIIQSRATPSSRSSTRHLNSHGTLSRRPVRLSRCRKRSGPSSARMRRSLASASGSRAVWRSSATSGARSFVTSWPMATP